MSTIRHYYHLQKDSFSIDPREDAQVYFGASEPHEKIMQRLRRDMVQPRSVPKLFIFARYGGGKTHTLANIEWVLTQDSELKVDYPTEPVAVAMPPLKAKDKWLTVHRLLIDALGLQRIRDAVSECVAGAGPAGDPVQMFKQQGIIKYGDAALQASLAQIFRNLLFGGRQAALSAEWLKGQKLSLTDSQTVMTETNLLETPQLIAALLNVGSLIHAGLKRKVVFLLDEAEAVRHLSNSDSLDDFRWALRELVDNKNNVLGLVAAVEAEGGQEDIPRLFTEDPIRRRVDYDAGYVDLEGLVSAPDDARAFIASVLAYLVDQDAAQLTISGERLATTSECFPFTPEALDLVTQHITEDPEKHIPSQIISILSQGVGAGWDRGREIGFTEHILVDEQLINEALYPQES